MEVRRHRGAVDGMIEAHHHRCVDRDAAAPVGGIERDDLWWCPGTTGQRGAQGEDNEAQSTSLL
jgi:hypothetical protein